MLLILNNAKEPSGQCQVQGFVLFYILISIYRSCSALKITDNLIAMMITSINYTPN
jgi:hypothetical protein